MGKYPVPWTNPYTAGIRLEPTIPPPPKYEDSLPIRDPADLKENCSYLLKKEGKGFINIAGQYIDEAPSSIEMLTYKGKRDNTGFFVLEWQNPDKENFGIPDNCQLKDIVKREFSKIGVTYEWEQEYGTVWSSDFYLVEQGYVLDSK